MLFHLTRLLVPPSLDPRVLGVDDFALCADVYDTLLVDAEARFPIEPWAGRDAEQLAAWLRTHPGVELVCPGWLAGPPPGHRRGRPGRGSTYEPPGPAGPPISTRIWSTCGNPGRKGEHTATGAAPGTPRPGLPQPLPANQDGHRNPASRPANQHAARVAALTPGGRPMDH